MHSKKSLLRYPSHVDQMRCRLSWVQTSFETFPLCFHACLYALWVTTTGFHLQFNDSVSHRLLTSTQALKQFLVVMTRACLVYIKWEVSRVRVFVWWYGWLKQINVCLLLCKEPDGSIIEKARTGI